MSSQITSLTIVYSTVYSGANQRKYQSSASLAFVRGFHRSPVNSPHKGPVTRKMFLFDDVIMGGAALLERPCHETWKRMEIIPKSLAIWNHFRDRWMSKIIILIMKMTLRQTETKTLKLNSSGCHDKHSTVYNIFLNGKVCVLFKFHRINDAFFTRHSASMS